MDKKSTEVTKNDLHQLGQRMEASVIAGTREVITHFNKSQGVQNEWMRSEFTRIQEKFVPVEVKLEAVIEMLSTKQEMANLVRELKAKGVAIDEAKIFVR